MNTYYSHSERQSPKALRDLQLKTGARVNFRVTGQDGSNGLKTTAAHLRRSGPKAYSDPFPLFCLVVPYTLLGAVSFWMTVLSCRTPTIFSIILFNLLYPVDALDNKMPTKMARQPMVFFLRRGGGRTELSESDSRRMRRVGFECSSQVWMVPSRNSLISFSIQALRCSYLL